jgi:hypothetical protein
MALAGPPTDKIRPQTIEAGFLAICRRVVDKGGVMLTLTQFQVGPLQTLVRNAGYGLSCCFGQVFRQPARAC